MGYCAFTCCCYVVQHLDASGLGVSAYDDAKLVFLLTIMCLEVRIDHHGLSPTML
jgi:hypothetical protein